MGFQGLLASGIFMLCSFSGSAWASHCGGAPSPDAKPNMNPPITDAPRLIRTAENALLYEMGKGNDTLIIVHLWGSSFEKGAAHARLMETEIRDFWVKALDYTEKSLEDSVAGDLPGWVPEWFADVLIDLGVRKALDLVWDIMYPFMDEAYIDEHRGLESVFGEFYLEYGRRLHMLGEITRGSCSQFGAWGNATSQDLGGRLLQFRALDWDTDGPFKDFVQLSVYHAAKTFGRAADEPNEGVQENSWASLSFTGFVGSITAFNDRDMAIGEIGVSFPDDSFGKESWIGTPFTNLIRHVAQYSTSYSDAIDIIQNTIRTCNLILGVGAHNSTQFAGIQYSFSVANVIDESNFLPQADWHPPIENIVYFGMDWNCPGYDIALANALRNASQTGQLNATYTMQQISGLVQSGNLHIVIYDWTNDDLYISVAKKSYGSGPSNAYDRPFMILSFKDLWNISAPSLEAKGYIDARRELDFDRSTNEA